MDHVPDAADRQYRELGPELQVVEPGLLECFAQRTRVHVLVGQQGAGRQLHAGFGMIENAELGPVCAQPGDERGHLCY
jgi:hypothetical protein